MEKEIKKRKYTVGSLFAGIGGICLGFQQAGYNVLWANEWDKDACITYRQNFNHAMLEGDIHSIDPKKLPRVDIVTSGFPCQAFSIAGYRKGFKDERGDLFFETMRFIDAVKPKAFLLENVKNLAGHDNGNTFRVIADYIRHSGYSVFSKVMNSMEYGGVPQNRERIYVVGFRSEADYFGEISKGCTCSSSFKFPEAIPLRKTVSDLLENKELDEKYYYSRFKKTNTAMYDMLHQSMTNQRSVYQWRRVYVRENKSDVCPTLTANMGTGGHNVPLIREGQKIRKLTPRECARLQGFPDNFILPKVADSQLYKQMGNSVTVPVIMRIAVNIKKALDEKYSSGKKRVKQEEYAQNTNSGVRP